MIDLPQFDPTDPFDIMADQFRRKVLESALDAMRVTVYRELPPTRQIECFLSGTMTGLIETCFASIDRKGRDAMMDYIQQCLPIARRLAEARQRHR